MPITGKFEADFSQFSSATQKAGQDLKDFGKTADDTTSQIGDVEKATKSLTGAIESVAGAFGIGFSVGALVDLVTTVNQEAAALQNLSITTRISVEDLQILQAATKEYGISGDQLGTALYQLSRRIAGGDGNVASAYASMGLSMDQVKAQSGDLMQLFLATEAGLAGVHGEAQSIVAQDLFGKMGNSLIAFSAGADQAVASAAEYVKIAGGDSVKASAAMATEVDRATQSMHAWVMEIEGNAARILNILTKNTELGKAENKQDQETIAGKTALFEQIAKNANANTDLVNGMQLTVGLGTQINALGQQSTAIKAEDVGKSKEQIAAQTFLDTLRLDAAKPLLDWQKQDLAQLEAWGQLTDQNGVKITGNIQQLKAYRAAQEDARKTEEQLAKDRAAFDSQLMTQYNGELAILGKVEAQRAKSYDLDTQISMLQQLAAVENVHALAVEGELTDEKNIAKVREDNYKRQTEIALEITKLREQQTAIRSASTLREIDLQTQLNAAYGRDAQGAIIGVGDALTEYQKKVDSINASTASDTEKTLALAVANQQLADSFLKDAQAADASTAAIQKASATAQTAAQAAAARASASMGGGKLPTGLSPEDQAAYTASLILQSAFGMPGGTVPNMAGADFTNPASAIAWALAHRAAGGPVSAGESYVVGEHGPELFTPGASGAITPSISSPSSLGGGGPIQIVINGSVLATQAELSDLVQRAMLEAYRRGGNRLPV